jgi:hypothetical protein
MAVPGPRPVAVPRRVGTSVEWATAHLILSAGEAGVESDTGVEKYGDGVHRWCDLPVAVDPYDTQSGVDSGALAAHIADPTPHPAYDDIPSVVVLYENGLI